MSIKFKPETLEKTFSPVEDHDGFVTLHSIADRQAQYIVRYLAPIWGEIDDNHRVGYGLTVMRKRYDGDDVTIVECDINDDVAMDDYHNIVLSLNDARILHERILAVQNGLTPIVIALESGEMEKTEDGVKESLARAVNPNKVHLKTRNGDDWQFGAGHDIGDMFFTCDI